MVAQLKDHDMRPMTIIKALETMLVIVIFMLNLGCHGNHYSLAMDVMITLSIELIYSDKIGNIFNI